MSAQQTEAVEIINTLLKVVSLNLTDLEISFPSDMLDDPNSPWFGTELELRNKNRLLPWDMLVRPGQYLVGAYPCLASLSAEQSKLKTLQKGTSISITCMPGNTGRLSGKAIGVLMQVHQEGAGAVVDLLRRQDVPKRLEPYQDNLEAMSDRGIGL